MKIKISKSQWEEMGKKAGWMKKASTQDAFLIRDIMTYPPKLIVETIKGLGEVSIAGFSGVTENDVPDVLAMCETYVLGEILDSLKKKMAQRQPELNMAKSKANKRA